MLGEGHREDYLRLVARAFVVDADVERARARLAALDEADPARAVAALAQRAAATGLDAHSVQALARLASALGAGPATPTSALPVASPEASETTDTLASPATPAAAPSRTPTFVPVGAFAFVGRQAVCDSRLAEPLIQVMVMDARGEQVPGVEVVVEWDGGFDHFFTGLKPELGNGYGDFTMTAGVSYNVHLVASPTAAVRGLAVEPCTDSAARPLSGSWLLVFREQ
jgi:hypothetical protein